MQFVLNGSDLYEMQFGTVYKHLSSPDVSAVLAFFLWPLISSPEVGLWLKPVLQKLDFGIGEFLQKVKENHGKHYT